MAENTGNEVCVVRAAAADDAEFLAWAMATAARSPAQIGFWDYLTGWDAESLHAFLVRLARSEPPHLYNASCFLIAEVDERRAGALSAFFPETQGFGAYIPVFAQLVSDIAGPDALAEMMERARLLTDLDVALPANRLHIESVAVVEEFRGRGVVDALLDAALDRGRAAGCPVAAIDTVFADNAAALHVYARHGFKTVQQVRLDAWEATFKSPGVDVLMRDL